MRCCVAQVQGQWCLGHLSDPELVSFLRRARAALRTSPAGTCEGFIVVKENVCADDAAEGAGRLFDDEDSSITRSDRVWRDVFDAAGLEIVRREVQLGFPQGACLSVLSFGGAGAAQLTSLIETTPQSSSLSSHTLCGSGTRTSTPLASHRTAFDLSLSAPARSRDTSEERGQRRSLALNIQQHVRDRKNKEAQQNQDPRPLRAPLARAP